MLYSGDAEEFKRELLIFSEDKVLAKKLFQGLQEKIKLDLRIEHETDGGFLVAASQLDTSLSRKAMAPLLKEIVC